MSSRRPSCPTRLLLLTLITKRRGWKLDLVNQITGGAAMVGLTNAVSAAALFVVALLVGRTGGAAELGRYGLMFALGSIFGGVVDFGTDRVLSERLAKGSSSWSYAWHAVVALKGTVAIVSISGSLLIWFLKGRPEPFLVITQAAAISSWLTLQAVTSAVNRLPILALARIASRLAGISVLEVLLVGVKSQGSAGAAILCMSTADIAVSLVVWWILWRRTLYRLPFNRFDSTAVIDTVRHAAPLGISSIAVWVYVKSDSLLLAGLVDLATLGTYTAAVRLAELLAGLAVAVNAVTLPALAKLHAESALRFAAARDFVIVSTAVALTTICLVIYLFADPIMALLYRFPDAALYLKIMIWAQIFAGTGAVATSALQVVGLNRLIARLTLTISVFGLVVYTVLIRLAGARGGAWGTLLTYAAILPLGLLLAKSRPTFIPFLRSAILLAPAAALGILLANIVGEGAGFWHQLVALVGFSCCILALLAAARPLGLLGQGSQ